MKDRLAKVMADKTTSTISFRLANPLPKPAKGAQPQQSVEEKVFIVCL